MFFFSPLISFVNVIMILPHGFVLAAQNFKSEGKPALAFACSTMSFVVAGLLSLPMSIALFLFALPVLLTSIGVDMITQGKESLETLVASFGEAHRMFSDVKKQRKENKMRIPPEVVAQKIE